METKLIWTGDGCIKACVHGRFMAAISPTNDELWIDILEFQPEKNGYSVPVMADAMAGFAANTLEQAMTRAEEELLKRGEQ